MFIVWIVVGFLGGFGFGAARRAKVLDPSPENTAERTAEIEARAAIIYAGLDYDGSGERPLWVDGGNSLKQDEARRLARAELAERQHDIEMAKIAAGCKEQLWPR
jgi:hypothetical protein